MAKRRRRSSSRKAPKTRTRTVTKYRTRTRIIRAKRRRGASSGGGGLPFRSSGGVLARVQGSALPVAKMALPIVAGATLAAVVAKKLGPRLGNDSTKVGAAVSALMLLLGGIAGKFRMGFISPRVVQLVALGGVADGGMRLLAKLRQSGRVPLLPKGNVGLLAKVPSPRTELDLAGRNFDPMVLTNLQD